MVMNNIKKTIPCSNGNLTLGQTRSFPCLGFHQILTVQGDLYQMITHLHHKGDNGYTFG